MKRGIEGFRPYPNGSLRSLAGLRRAPRTAMDGER